MMTQQTDVQIFHLFTHLFNDEIKWLMEHKPLLAHYTSISNLEKILKDDEIWLSNPLFMNDLEEVLE